VDVATWVAAAGGRTADSVVVAVVEAERTEEALVVVAMDEEDGAVVADVEAMAMDGIRSVESRAFSAYMYIV
jgi:hypothetical protein